MEWITEYWEEISLAFIAVVQAIKALILIFKKKPINNEIANQVKNNPRQRPNGPGY